MQEIVISSFAAALKLVPKKLRKGLIVAVAQDELFAKEYGRKAVAAFAPFSGITGVIANGESGVIISAPNDFIVHKTYAETGQWAKSTVDIFVDFFTENNGRGTFLDIGANIGLTTIPIVNRFPNVKSISFEPEPINFANLTRNILLNCVQGNNELLQLALFSEESELKFELNNMNLGDHRIRLDGSKPGKEEEQLRPQITVRAVPLDSFEKKIAGPIAVKIDVQGAEPFVFLGGHSVLSKAELIILEWSPYLLSRLGGDYTAVLDFIANNFSRCEIHNGDGLNRKSDLSIEDTISALKERFGAERHDIGTNYDLILRK
ncbi:methyltransferase, FkbM family [Methylobacterium phyllostachyos]|uniref:Methyltransferase, FkbM family n=1 Tax=Methylobacterium phyllostachyos TaxID=582672 RepID=A0A1G9RA29_9HYPH|nr:FkbM family methyltransferase [Methylobacterium phyllostachyos]SDM19960.1 methyltransferase, FkbM family [Methylobacterium phyllostachyos]